MLKHPVDVNKQYFSPSETLRCRLSVGRFLNLPISWKSAPSTCPDGCAYNYYFSQFSRHHVINFANVFSCLSHYRVGEIRKRSAAQWNTAFEHCLYRWHMGNVCVFVSRELIILMISLVCLHPWAKYTPSITTHSISSSPTILCAQVQFILIRISKSCS